MTLPQAVPPYVLTPLSGLFLIGFAMQHIESQMAKRFPKTVCHALRLFLIRCSLGFISGNDFHSNR